MRISAGTLFLAFAVFFNSVELMSSIETTLEELFPGYNGVLPSIKEFSSQRLEQSHNFRQLDGMENMLNPRATFLARGHVIVGSHYGDYINPPCTLSTRDITFVVFDTIKDQWDALSPGEFYMLGPNRLFSLVRARDEVAATHKLASGRPMLDKEAHIRAVEKANLVTNRIENQQGRKLCKGETTLEQSIRFIKEGYSFTYIRAFQRYLQKRAGV